MIMKYKKYRHSFYNGYYLGCREVSKFELIKSYLHWSFGIVVFIGVIHLFLINANARFDKERPSIILEVPSR